MQTKKALQREFLFERGEGGADPDSLIRQVHTNVVGIRLHPPDFLARYQMNAEATLKGQVP